MGGSTVDLTLTGIVGVRMAPTPGLATVPFSVLFLAAGLSTFVVSRAIGRFGHRLVFTAAAAVAAFGGGVSAIGIQLGRFWLFCVGTAMVGVYTAAAAYYRYLAAESMPRARARAVSQVLAGGLLAAIVGPFLATALQGVTSTAYVGSYLLVAVLGAAASIWNLQLPAHRSVGRSASGTEPERAPRGYAALWKQPMLLTGVAAAVLAAATMLAMMTAGPILGLAAGHTETEAAFAVQLHMVGMFAPGFLVARVMGRVGEYRIALIGAVVIAGAGLAAGVSTELPAFLIAMFAVGVGWNLAYSGGSALISAAYHPTERNRVHRSPS